LSLLNWLKRGGKWWELLLGQCISGNHWL
jgi:hypothetical protein